MPCSFSKLAALRITLEGITRKRRNAYRSHHTSGESTDLATLKDIYVELAALRSYCDLNQTGFYKIIKKYDKIMEVRGTAESAHRVVTDVALHCTAFSLIAHSLN
jgi:SPX domain protein involved in polyphosphate accumulation